MLNIREFIYLDVERLKSIMSQIEEGLLLEVTEEKGKELGANGEIGTGDILGLAVDAKAMGNILINDSERETKTLHDYMYSIVEKKLLDEKSIIEIPDEKDINKRITTWPKGLTDNSFVLLRGKIKIEDYSILSRILDNMNDLSIAFSVITSESKSGLYEGEQQWEFSEICLEKNNQLLDKSYIKAMSLIINHFYKDKLLITCMPYRKNSNLTFVANLNRQCLRESIDEIIFKYGSLPLSDWFIFGRVSTILPKVYHSIKITDDPVYKRIKSHWEEVNGILNSTNSFKELNDIGKKNGKV